MADPVDTNVVVRFLVEDAETVQPEFRGVFSFFVKLERGERAALLTPLVLFQSYFVLTSYYEVPRAEAASKLREILSFKGLRVQEKVCCDRASARWRSARPTSWTRIWQRWSSGANSAAFMHSMKA